jgi:hypothetical protein
VPAPRSSAWQSSPGSRDKGEPGRSRALAARQVCG